MDDGPKQQPIEVDLPKPEKQPAAKKGRAPWPKDFDPLKPPPRGYAYHVPEDEWRVIHGETPLAVFSMRGRFIMVDPGRVSEAGYMGETMRVEKGCRNCSARVFVVVPDAVICVGCGATL